MDPYASHLPALSFVLDRLGSSIRSILEVGAGSYSTPLLHAFATGAADRGCKHVVLESNAEWRETVRSFFDIEVRPFDAMSLPDAVAGRYWDLAFIDCEVEASRAQHALRLREKAGVILLHDSNPDWDRAYGYSRIIPEWKHSLQFTECYPHSLLLTNDEEAWGRLCAATTGDASQ